MTKVKEIFVWIRGFEGKYKVSNLGRVFSVNGKWKGVREMNGSIDGAGYRVFSFRKKGKPKLDWRLHRLLAEHFIPNPKKFESVDHVDGNKANNGLSNLRWCTRAQNVRWAFNEQGLVDTKGEKHFCAKLTEKEVIYARKEVAKGRTHREVWEEIGKSTRRNLTDAINGVTWAWLTPTIDDFKKLP